MVWVEFQPLFAPLTIHNGVDANFEPILGKILAFSLEIITRGNKNGKSTLIIYVADCRNLHPDSKRSQDC